MADSVMGELPSTCSPQKCSRASHNSSSSNRSPDASMLDLEVSYFLKCETQVRRSYRAPLQPLFGDGLHSMANAILCSSSSPTPDSPLEKNVPCTDALQERRLAMEQKLTQAVIAAAQGGADAFDEWVMPRGYDGSGSPCLKSVACASNKLTPSSSFENIPDLVLGENLHRAGMCKSRFTQAMPRSPNHFPLSNNLKISNLRSNCTDGLLLLATTAVIVARDIVTT